jgi:hypothetical protein
MAVGIGDTGSPSSSIFGGAGLVTIGRGRRDPIRDDMADCLEMVLLCAENERRVS